MAALDGAAGDTLYVLTAAQAPLVLDLGNQADGRRLYVANVDAVPNQVRVELQGSVEGERAYLLTGKGDAMVIPGGDIVRVIITASAYPTSIAWAYLIPHMDVWSGQRR